MLNIINFKDFISEAAFLTPGELKKKASGGPNEGLSRLEILAMMVKKQEPLTIKKGGKQVIVANTEEVLASIAQFKKDGKSFKFTSLDGKTYSTSDIKKSTEFGGGAGAGGGTVSTAIGESAQCVWFAAMLEIGSAMPIDSFTDKVLTKAFKSVNVGRTSLEDILALDDSWRNSSYLTAKYAMDNDIIERGMFFHRDDKFMKAIYATKNTAFKNNGFKPLESDKWNPGDVWASQAGFKMNELDTTSVEGINNDILDLFLQQRLVGISLKMVKKAVTHVEKNVERPPLTSDYKFTSGRIRTSKTWYSTKSNFLDFLGGEMAIRANSSFGTHKVEIKGKGARGGGAGWGVMQDAVHRVYKKKLLPKNADLVKEAKMIAAGDKDALENFTSMLQKHDKTISIKDVAKELKKFKRDAAVWVHAKLGGLYVLNALAAGGKKADQFITQLVNYAGSTTSDSSAYVKLMEK